jgi:hypothetical protein
MDQLQKNGFVVVQRTRAGLCLRLQDRGAISKRVRVIYAVPEKETPEIRYPVAILRETKRRAAAEDSSGISVLPTRSRLRAPASLCSADVARAR